MKQTAGKEKLGKIAPQFAHLNDDVLFGEVWSRENELSLRDRSLVTIIALMAQGTIDDSFLYHLQNGKNNGLTRQEISEAITHAAFYCGWPKAWAAFNLATTVWPDEPDDKMIAHQKQMIFPIGKPNDQYARYFKGQSYLLPLCQKPVAIANVTFAPACCNNWHIHQAVSGGGQILLAIAGKGYYQEWGQDKIELNPGDIVVIKSGVKHWHGATRDQWFSHLAIEVPGKDTFTQWLDEVNEKEYDK